MVVSTYKVKKEHIKFGVLIIGSIKGYNFHSRELALATEYLHWAYLYSKQPLLVTVKLPDGSEEKVIFENIFSMVRHKDTLIRICKSLDMSWTVLRKHTKGLKDKGFFKSGSFNKDFSSVLDQSINVNLVYNV